MKQKYLNKKDTELAIIQILEVLLDESVPFSGSHRKKQWEKGWGENHREKTLVPKYFGKHSINRKDGKLVVSEDPDYELNALHGIIRDVAGRHLRGVDHLYEFGCGTGHNLTVAAVACPKATVHGLDWTKSSQKILRAGGIDAANFDFFSPNNRYKLAKNSGVMTVAALEQTGTDYRKFVNYLIRKNPEVVVHVEPIPELLDPSILLDYLSIRYMEKRRYLSGYLDYLKSLEKKGKIEIIEARRSGVGSFLIDGYSIIVWKPLKN